MEASPLHACLVAGERLLWTGRPAQGPLFTVQDIFLVPFSLLWGGFALFWEAGAIASDAPLLFRLWGIPFVLVGLYMIAGRFVIDAWLRGRTWYGVTDRRVLILREAPFHSFIALDLAGLRDIRVSSGWGGRGTIRFGDEPWGYYRQFHATPWSPSMSGVPQFLAIRDPETVFARIEVARTRA